MEMLIVNVYGAWYWYLYVDVSFKWRCWLSMCM